MRPALPLLALVAFASAGCATLPACPAKGGPAWTEWTSSHFKLFTDLDADDAARAVRDFEELRAAMLIAAWRRAPEPRERVTVIVFRGSAERRVFMPGKYIAAVVAIPALHLRYILKDGVDRDATVTHGLAALLEGHYGLSGKVKWFDEGLASYLDGLTLDSDGTLTYGQLDPELFRALAQGHRLPFEQLWQPITPEAERQFIATSWLAVHYLFNHEPERLAEFQRRLASGQDAAGAWRAVFPDLTPEAMDDCLSRYLFRGGEYLTYKARLSDVKFVSASRPVDDATVHALRALLYAGAQTLSAASRPPAVRAEVAEALRLDPLQPIALYIQRFSLHDDETDIEAPKRLIARRPDDPFGWLVLAQARTARHETAEAAEAWEEVRARATSTDPPVDLDVRIARPE